MDIFDAIERNDAEGAMKILKKRKAHANRRRHHETPLHVAAEQGYTDIIRLLIDYGALVNTSNGSPLHSACRYGKLQAALVLLEEGADPTTGCNLGNTPLHVASSFGKVNVMSALMQHEIDINSQNVDGWTPLHRSSYCGKIDAVTYLLHQGADADVKTNAGRTAYDLAVSTRQYDIAEHILRYRKPVTSPTKPEGLKILLQTKKEQFGAFITRKHESYKNRRQSTMSEDESDHPPPQGVKIRETPRENNREKLRELKANMVILTKELHKLPAALAKKNQKEEEDDDEENECPICFQIPLPPTSVYQCTNGHIYCGKCKNMPNMSKCPQCAVNIQGEGFRNRYAEENIRKIYEKKSAAKN